MTGFPLRRAILAGVLASAAVVPMIAPMPAYAQFGGIVYDPTNYAQNVLTAARSLQQINNQIQQIQQQATSLINEARNLASLPLSTVSTLQQQIQLTAARLNNVSSDGSNKEDRAAKWIKPAPVEENNLHSSLERQLGQLR